MNWIKTINKKIIRLQPATTNKQNKTKQKLWLDDDPFWLFLLGMREWERERNRTQTQITDCIQITFIFALAKKWAQFDWFIHFSLNADRVSNIWQSLISNYLYIHRIQFDVGLKKVSSSRQHFWYKQPNEWQKKRHHFHKILNYVGEKE